MRVRLAVKGQNAEGKKQTEGGPALPFSPVFVRILLPVHIWGVKVENGRKWLYMAVGWLVGAEFPGLAPLTNRGVHTLHNIAGLNRLNKGAE